MHAALLTSPIGPLYVEVDNGRLTRLYTDGHSLHAPADPPSHAVFGEIQRQLDEYFAGTRKAFTASVDLSYADPAHFGRRVLETLAREVPWGETVTYGELADMVGAPRAARAVGNVMAHNPVQILLPCHRVVAAHGIGGYGSAGVGLKRVLLELEGVRVP
jgi:methylated-DNA-[protein]-cysteine S-methyltransferase